MACTIAPERDNLRGNILVLRDEYRERSVVLADRRLFGFGETGRFGAEHRVFARRPFAIHRGGADPPERKTRPVVFPSFRQING